MSKHKARPNPNTRTPKGAFVLATDREYLYTCKRHESSEIAVTEAKRLAELLKERILILRVAGAIDRRTKKQEQPEPERQP